MLYVHIYSYTYLHMPVYIYINPYTHIYCEYEYNMCIVLSFTCDVVMDVRS